MGKKNPITRKIIPTSSFAATTALMMAAAALMLSIPVSNTAATAQEVDLMIETASYMYWVMMAIRAIFYLRLSLLLTPFIFLLKIQCGCIKCPTIW
jgi:hypothetical protein